MGMTGGSQSGNVRLHLPGPFFIGDGADRATPTHDARHIDCAVETAEGLYGVRDPVVDLLCVTDVNMGGQHCCAILGLEVSLGRFEGLLVIVAYQDFGALLSQSSGDLESNAAGAAWERRQRLAAPP